MTKAASTNFEYSKVESKIPEVRKVESLNIESITVDPTKVETRLKDNKKCTHRIALLHHNKTKVKRTHNAIKPRSF